MTPGRFLMHLDNRIELRGPANRLGRRRPAGRARGGSVMLVALLLVVNYFVFFRGDDAPPPGDAQALASLSGSGAGEVALSDRGATAGDGALVDPTRRVDDFGEPTGRKVSGELKRGQTILAALRGLGIDSHSARPIVQSMGEIFDFRKAQVGDVFTAHIDDDGRVVHFRYTQSPLDIYEVVLGPEGEYEASKKKVPTRIDVAHIGCAIRSSLYASITRCGEGSELAAAVIDLLAWDIDFFQDIRDNDLLRVVVEKISVDGRFLRYGRVLAAEYAGKFGTHRIVHYRDPDGVEGYYKPDGHAAKKEFVKSPLKYSRVASDGNAGVRKNLRTASAVTYHAAPKTPVQAVASGTILTAGAHASGEGFTVSIRHDNGFVSTYSHLGSLARGIKPGALVSQKTVIGKLGRKSDAEGARLQYSLRKDGRFVNPLKATFAEGAAVSPDHRAHFEHTVKSLLETLGEIPVDGAASTRG
jgi:murein DD-endopeptidase MepM/ murein hydrolase activator NlpD